MDVPGPRIVPAASDRRVAALKREGRNTSVSDDARDRASSRAGTGLTSLKVGSSVSSCVDPSAEGAPLAHVLPAADVRAKLDRRRPGKVLGRRRRAVGHVLVRRADLMGVERDRVGSRERVCKSKSAVSVATT